MSESPAADEDRRRISAFLGSHDWLVVRQGMELAMSLGGDDVLQRLRKGVALDESGVLEIGDGWGAANGIRPAVRENLALLLLSLGQDAPIRGAEALDLAGLEFLSDISPLASATSLRRLRLDQCAGLTDASVLGSLESLRSLSARGAPILGTIPPACAARLESLSIGMAGESSLAPLAGAVRLRKLVLDDAESITDLAPLAGLERLESLVIDGLAIGDLAPIGGLASLRYLEIECRADVDLAPLAGLSGLEELVLRLYGKFDVSRLLGQGSLARLRVLDMQSCSTTGWGLAGVRAVPALEEFRVPHVVRNAHEMDLLAHTRGLVAGVNVRAQLGRDAPQLLGALVLVDAVYGAAARSGGWKALRESFAAAIAIGGPRLAAAALGSVLARDGAIRPGPSSPIRRLAERTGGDWLDDAVLMLMSAAGWPEVDPHRPLDLSSMSITDPAPLATLPPGAAPPIMPEVSR